MDEQVRPELLGSDASMLLESTKRLAESYSFSHNNRVKVTSLLKLLLSESCERKLDYALRNPVNEDKRFDPIYRERSDFATGFIIERLKNKLTHNGIKVTIATEERSSELGIYDVTIRIGEPCVVYSAGRKRVRIEIKASAGMRLEQLQRYLLDTSPLILVRVLQGHVLLLRQEQFEKFVDYTVQDTLAKIERIASKQLYVVSGPSCLDCRDTSCPFHRDSYKNSKSFVTMNNECFAEEMTSFFRNLPIVAEKTASLVTELLSGSSTQGDEETGCS
ncbi:MAG: hypothetical protein QXE12_00120 [Conexivisphaerales archaeon]